MDMIKELERLEAKIIQQFETKKEHLYPCLKPMDTETQFEVGEGDEKIVITLPHIPFLGKMCIFFMIDEGEDFQILQKRMMPHTMKESELLPLAMENLVRDYHFEIFEAEYGGYALKSNPDHTSSYLLLMNIWKSIAEKDFKEDIVLCVPARDVILFVKESDKEGIKKLQQTAQKVYDNDFKSLSLSLLKYDKEKGVLEEYTPELQA